MSIEENVRGGKAAEETFLTLKDIAAESPEACRQRFWERLKELCYAEAHPPMTQAPDNTNLIAQIGSMVVPFGNSKGEKFSNAKLSDLTWIQARLEEQQAILKLLNIYLSDPTIRAEKEQCER